MNNNLIVLVKKYFDKAIGNTYHSVQFEIDNKIYHSGKKYGYERQYEDTFKDIIIKSEKMSLCHSIGCHSNHSVISKKTQKISNPKYFVIENCKAKELKEIHKYK